MSGIKHVVQLEHHRNGVCGLPFHVAIVDDEENGKMTSPNWQRARSDSSIIRGEATITPRSWMPLSKTNVT